MSLLLLSVCVLYCTAIYEFAVNLKISGSTIVQYVDDVCVAGRASILATSNAMRNVIKKNIIM